MAEGKGTEAQRMMQEVREIHGGIGAILDLLEKIVKQLAQQAKPSAVPVATREMLYPELCQPTPPEAVQTIDPPSAAPSSSSWRGLFARKGSV